MGIFKNYFHILERGMKVIFLYYIQGSDKPNVMFKIFDVIQLQQDKIILPIQG